MGQSESNVGYDVEADWLLLRNAFIGNIAGGCEAIADNHWPVTWIGV